MPRPVTGYLTSQGKYFDSEKEATLYELSHEVNKQIIKYLKNIGVTDAYEEDSANQIHSFIILNETILCEYLLARRAFNSEQGNHEVDRQAEPNTSKDDPPVWVRDDIPVDTNTNAEDTTENTGKKAKR